MSERKSRLRLTSERLAELTTDELSDVVGGAYVSLTCLTGTETYKCPTQPGGITYGCFTGNYTS